jgi:tetratricopeptide (TPR) repeat protein
MEARFLSRFTPSLMPQDALEAIFVQREALLKAILDRIRTSILNPEKKNTLLVGPRGIGKTHLISLVYYRLQSMKEIQAQVLVAWLREEEWGIGCLRDLLFRILRVLLPEDDNRLKAVFKLAPAAAELGAVKLIGELVGNRTLVLLIENLNDLVRKLGIQGEAQFCRLLKQGGCCVVASSPGPLASVFLSASPFRQGFFHTEQLKELDYATAVRLIARIAEYQGDKELTALLETPRGRARVRALRSLAGGNHRAYIVFAHLLVQESIEDLIGPLMQTIDNLTPYYVSQIAALPWEQRQILEYICEIRHPVRLSDISRNCFLPNTAASAQLENLCARGHLQKLRTGSSSYYELREPLMRLSFEVKKNRGKPIGLFWDFLRMWYSPAELKQKLSVLPAQGVSWQGFLPDLKTLDQNWDDPRVPECCRDYSEAAEKGDYEHALEALNQLVAIRGSKEDSIAQISCLVRLDRLEQALSICSRLARHNRQDALIWRLHASILSRMSRYEPALSSCRKSLELDADSGDAWNCESAILLNLGRPEEALSACESALKLNQSDPVALINLGSALVQLELFDEASRTFSQVLSMEPRNTKARNYLAAALIELKHWDDALNQAVKASEISPEEPEPWVLKGSALSGLGRNDESFEAFSRAVSMGENSAFVQFKIGELLLSLGRWREWMAHLDRTLAQFSHTDNPNAGDTKALMQCLLANLSEPKILRLLMQLLLLIYRKHRIIGALIHGIIAFIPDLISAENLSDEDASFWLDSWEQAASKNPEFRLPLRLMEAAVHYRRTHDSSVFVTLSPEERSVLKTLLGVRVEAIA